MNDVANEESEEDEMVFRYKTFVTIGFDDDTTDELEQLITENGGTASPLTNSHALL